MRVVETTETEGGFAVRVDDGAGVSEHRVTIGPGYLEGLGVDVPPAELVRASFHFLLDREPKESILRAFDLSVIERYFPEYRSVIGSYLED